MFEENSNLRHRVSFKPPSIDNWEQFKNTWKNIWFTDQLNEMEEPALQQFWREQLTKLEKETEKYCILVPNLVNKTERKIEEKILQKEKNESIQKKNPEKIEKSKNQNEKERLKQDKKNEKNNNKKKPNNQIKLDKKVIQIAEALISKEFDNIQFVYESLFMGNPKQLLIYRSCSSMNRYLQRYRLPNDFKPKLQQINKIMDEMYEKKIRSNIAISTFSVRIRDQIQQELSILKQQYQKSLAEFLLFLKPVLHDFNSNSKTISMTIQGVRSEMLEIIRQIADELNLKVSNKFYQTDFDEARDITIEKKCKLQEKSTEESLQAEKEEVTKYVYVEVPKTPEVPKDIYNAKLIKKNLANQSWIWRIFLPTCSNYNQFKGLYLRAPEGEGPSQLTVEVESTVQDIEIELFPYQQGKVTWQIYIWNDVGFTKSTEKIIFFNDLEVKGIVPSGKNYRSEIIGFSQLGLILDDPKLKKTVQKVRQISIYNSIVICDADGTCGGWGQMYYPENEQKQTYSEEDISLQFFNNQRIENPFLILKGQFIRKVSCGMGYVLMLSSLGGVWSFGFNGYGQLGQGHLNSDYYCTEPRQLSKFTVDSSNLVTEICATCKGSSFALDDKGKLYRWGYNQVQETFFPVYDNFQTPINFQTKQTIYKNSTPLVLSKMFINGHVKTVEASNEHYYALTKEGDLYGWGVVKMLGLGTLKNPQQTEILDVVNPIWIKDDIQTVSTNFHHTIAVTTKGRILGWGKAENFSNKLTGFLTKPVDITDQYLSSENEKMRIIRAGISYTVIVREDNKLEIVGSETLLEAKSSYQKNKIVDIACSKLQECLAILSDE